MHMPMMQYARTPRESMNLRMGLYACLWASLLIAPALRGSEVESDEARRAAFEKWIETKRMISEEKTDWRTGKQILEDRIQLVRREIDGLREKAGQATNDIAEATKGLAELQKQNEDLKTNAAALADTVGQMEARVQNLLVRTPDPVREKVKPLSARIPKNAADTNVSLAERFQGVLGIVNECAKANGEITVATEIRTLSDGRSAEVKTVYLGLAQAFFVSAKGEAGIGRPGDQGWQWDAANNLAPTITDVIQIMQNKASARFVPLPVRIH
jgi:FtsZ-binding cell division protein ZapB